MHKSIVTNCYRIACSVKQIQEVKTQEFQKASETSEGRSMFLSQCASYNSKKSKFIKEQEAGGLLDQNVCIR